MLANGNYLLPLYYETGHDPESTGADSASVFYTFDPKTKAWSELGRIRSAMGNLQPSVVELEPGHLIAYCRRTGDYLPKTQGFVVRSESHDGGKTWSPGLDSAFPNPNAAVDFLKLKSGNLLLVYNDCYHGRSPLTVALSPDGDKTYPRKRNLATGRTAISLTRSRSRPATARSMSSTRRKSGPSSTTPCSTSRGWNDAERVVTPRPRVVAARPSPCSDPRVT